MTTEPWVCDQGDGTFDHDWKISSDSDDTGRWQFRECRVCGETDYETPIDPPDFDDDY